MKKKVYGTLILFPIAIFFVTIACADQPVHAGLSLDNTISLPDVKGRIDHMAYDRNGQRIFICALGNNSVEVVDVKNYKTLFSIKNIAEPQGIVFDSARKMIAVSSGGDGWLRFYNSETYRMTDSILIGSDADNVRYDNDRTLYIGYDGGIAKVDLVHMTKYWNFETDGHVEAFQLDLNRKKLFANVPDAYQLEIHDLSGKDSTVKWNLHSTKDNFPMAIDTASALVFIACRHPSEILVMNEMTGKIYSQIACSNDADDIFYDHNDHLLFVSAGEGFVDVFHDSSFVYTRVQHLPTRLLARTSLYDEIENKYFVAVPVTAGRSAELRIYDLR
ncbi:MAG TPA: hypothetical protein VL651_07455 [Bacteroidia bacterium]|jgi:hypothetical protein|nr:hypothetical protein [Bacteroidia bacterium]